MSTRLQWAVLDPVCGEPSLLDSLIPSSLVETLEDPRGDRTRRHQLTDILVQPVLAVILPRRCVRHIRQSLIGTVSISLIRASTVQGATPLHLIASGIDHFDDIQHHMAVAAGGFMAKINESKTVPPSSLGTRQRLALLYSNRMSETGVQHSLRLERKHPHKQQPDCAAVGSDDRTEN